MATGHATVAGLRLAALQEMVRERNRLHSSQICINDFFHQKHGINPFFDAKGKGFFGDITSLLTLSGLL